MLDDRAEVIALAKLNWHRIRPNQESPRARCCSCGGTSVLKMLKNIIHAIWAAIALTTCTAVGAMYGFHRHGWIGTIALGFVGLCAGTLAAACLLECLDLLASGW
jgi:hypothetical protein